MAIAPTHRPIVGQARVGIRGARVPARTVRVGVASPSQGPNSIPEEKRSPSVQTYLTEAVRSVFQTETGKDVKFKSPQWVQTPIPAQAAQSLLKLPLLALPAPKDGVTEVPPSFKRYVVEMLEKAAASKDADATEPKWKVNEFKGRISHRHSGDHHDH